MPEFNTKAYLEEAKRKAKRLGVDVEYSKTGKKKLDVFKKGKKVASIGGNPKIYSDFIQHKDPERRKRYRKRHAKYSKIKGSNSYYAKNILW